MVVVCEDVAGEGEAEAGGAASDQESEFSVGGCEV